MQSSFLFIIVLCPLVAALFNAGFYFYNLKEKSVSSFVFALVGMISSSISFVLTIILLIKSIGVDTAFYQNIFTWIDLNNLQVQIKFIGTNFAIFASLFILLISLVANAYTIFYMKSHEICSKFLIFSNFILFFILLLIFSDNVIAMLISWQGISICLYLFILFYFTKKEDLNSVNKIFIINKIGDLCFILAVAILFFAIDQKSLNMSEISKNISLIPENTSFLIGILIFLATIIKSSQFVHIWLSNTLFIPILTLAFLQTLALCIGVYVFVCFGFIFEQIKEVGFLFAYGLIILATIIAVVTYEIYNFLLLKPLFCLSKIVNIFDEKFISKTVAATCKKFVNLGRKVEIFQNGNIRFYAMFILFGISCVFLYLYILLLGQIEWK